MKRTIIAVTLSIFTCPIANAEINVVQVPAACGTIAEVRDFLSRYVENRQTVGIGRNSQEEPTVVLVSGTNGHWAMVASMSPTQSCIIASGHSWQPVTARDAKAL